jgi:hypothetical protein
MSKNNVVIVISTVVVLVLLGVLAVLLVGVGRLTISQKQLSRLKGEWRQFYQRNPFPSQENVLKEKENNKTILLWFDDLMKTLRVNQIEPGKNKSASLFRDVLVEKRNKMLELAAGKVPDKFGFGFGRYLAGGAPAAPENVPILTQQLLITEELFHLFLTSNVKEIVSITREEFDAAGGTAEAGATGSGRSRLRAGAAVPPPGMTPTPSVVGAKPGTIEGDALYGRLHFVFEFKAKESVVWEVLNRLAACNMIVVVTSVQMDSEGEDVVKLGVPTSAEKGAGVVPEAEVESGKDVPKVRAKTDLKEKERIPSRRERLVCGQAKALPMKVRMEMDVYRFRGE